jgi:hypothetical protein
MILKLFLWPAVYKGFTLAACLFSTKVPSFAQIGINFPHENKMEKIIDPDAMPF